MLIFNENKHKVEYYENYINKSLSEFTTKNTLYVAQEDGWYFCKFVKFEKGIVYVKIMEKQSKWNSGEVGDVLTVRPTSCCLWGKDAQKGTYSFYWFDAFGKLRT